MTAIVEYKGSAACCSDHSRLRLENAVDGTLTDPGIVVEAARAKLKPHWIGDSNLVVEACGATEISAISRMLKEPVVKADGSINAVRIEVVTASNTQRNGALYCSESAQS